MMTLLQTYLQTLQQTINTIVRKSRKWPTFPLLYRGIKMQIIDLRIGLHYSESTFLIGKLAMRSFAMK